MKVIGLLGGTFNPIHFGHLRMAQELADTLSFDEVRFIPSANPPHKPNPSVTAKHRAAMVRLGIANNPTFSFDDRELHTAGASYTIDTLQSLRDELGNDVSLVLLMGSDAFTKFDTWHRWEEIIQRCHITLVQRPHTRQNSEKSTQEIERLPKILETFLHNHYTENGDDLHESPAGFITMQQVTALDISSTAIRQALPQKKSARYLMPDNVIDYIHTQQLYDI
ncbi:MAG: nicotinate-nucleotide adenylyltransferase [Methylotenera sp.]